MSEPLGFSFAVRKNGEVAISSDNAVVTVLRGRHAIKFLVDIDTQDPQPLMARRTGNYKRGNERSRR